LRRSINHIHAVTARRAVDGCYRILQKGRYK
jgi:hypothetical protein